MKDAGERRRDLSAQIAQEAALAYTAGAARQVLYLASYLLSAWRPEDELAERLALVVNELMPPNAQKLNEHVARLAALEKRRLKEAQQRLKAQSSKKGK